jgi:UDP-N-acetyl-D-mannosaminuronate dehydrogenase
MKISVVGLEYVGLPLAIQFARANVPVLGLDVDAANVDLIKRAVKRSKAVAFLCLDWLTNPMSMMNGNRRAMF